MVQERRNKATKDVVFKSTSLPLNIKKKDRMERNLTSTEKKEKKRVNEREQRTENLLRQDQDKDPPE